MATKVHYDDGKLLSGFGRIAHRVTKCGMYLPNKDLQKTTDIDSVTCIRCLKAQAKWPS